jgi:hypothetical protein
MAGSMTRAFKAGVHGRIGEIEWRVVRGKKESRVPGAEDLRLDIRALEFFPVSMGLGFLLAEFFCENEEVLYPRAAGYSGGGRYLHFVAGAVRQGWETAAEQLKLEREEADRRRAA